MLEVEDALVQIYRAMSQQTKTEEVAILDSLGRFCAEDLWAQIPVPNFARAGMDGYAVRAAETQGASPETPVLLPVTATVYAGTAPVTERAVSGGAVKIMTGAPIPVGFDAVIKQEWTDFGTNEVQLYHSVVKGDNYGAIGEDVSSRQKLINQHQRINSRIIGVLASQGIESIRVFVPMKVGVLTTGSELIVLKDPLSEGKIYNSNLYTITAFLQGSGSEVILKKHCVDQVDQLVQAIETDIEGLDLLITTGGVSVGAKDYIPEAIQQLNAQVLFRYVNMKPGTPIMASAYQGCIILSVSGNPFAAMINLHMFYWPILAYFMNCPELSLRKRYVRLADDLPFTKLRRFIRAYETDNVVSLACESHRASVFQNTVNTNCFIDQPSGTALKKGELVPIYYWKF